MDDPAGIDLAEFCWTDDTPGREHRRYRVWDYQWPWYQNEETYQIDQAGRSLGKSHGILMRAFAFPYNFPGQEMLITAPELNHLGPIADKVEDKFLTIRFGREMLPRQKGGGIKHQPQFQATFANGARIMGRLPGRDGKGVKGQHPLVLEADEMQDYPRQGWIELIETMKSGIPGAQWRCPRGVQRRAGHVLPDDVGATPTSRSTSTATWPCTGPPGARRSASRRSPSTAAPGTTPTTSATSTASTATSPNPVFVLARLMACVRINESTWATEYNENVYNQDQDRR